MDSRRGDTFKNKFKPINMAVIVRTFFYNKRNKHNKWYLISYNEYTSHGNEQIGDNKYILWNVFGFRLV